MYAYTVHLVDSKGRPMIDAINKIWSCSHPGCTETRYLNGLCRDHYAKKYDDINTAFDKQEGLVPKTDKEQPMPKTKPLCAFPGSDKQRYLKGLCWKHYHETYGKLPYSKKKCSETPRVPTQSKDEPKADESINTVSAEHDTVSNRDNNIPNNIPDLSVNFDGHVEEFVKLKSLAYEDFRTPEMEILWLIDQEYRSRNTFEPEPPGGIS